MASSKEKINIILMRDSGESKRFRMYRSNFRALLTCCILCPFITAAALAGSYWFWEQNMQLVQRNMALEQENSVYQITTKRLGHLEKLLTRHEDVEKKIAVQIAAQKNEKSIAEAENLEQIQKSAAQQEGPGHDEFPVLDTGVLQVENVSSIVLEKERIRTSFSLRNKGSESISGEVFCILSLASGKTLALMTTPPEAGKYKIANFKSAVLYSDIPEKIDLKNAEMVLEVKNATGEVVYRNVYPLSQ